MDATGASDSSSTTPRWRPENDGLTDPYVDLPRLVSERLGGVGAWLRAHPLLGAAVVAVPVGALIGLLLARRKARTPVESVEQPVRKAGERARKTIRRAGKRARGRRPGRLAFYGDLLSIGLKLWENPLVRALVLQALARRVARRLS